MSGERNYKLDAWLMPRSILKDLILNYVKRRYEETWTANRFTLEEPKITLRELERELKIPRPLILDLLSELDMKSILKIVYSHKLKEKIVKLKVSLEDLDEIMSTEGIDEAIGVK